MYGPSFRPLPGHEDVGELEETLRERPEHAAQEWTGGATNSATRSVRVIAKVFGVTSAKTNSSSVITIVATISPALAEVPNRERGGDRRAADREQQREEQHHVEVRGGVLDDPGQLHRASPIFLDAGGPRAPGSSA